MSIKKVIICFLLIISITSLHSKEIPDLYERIHIDSKVLGIEVPCNIYLPEDYYKSEREYPIIYFLHPFFFFSGIDFLQRKHFDNYIINYMYGFRITRALEKSRNLSELEDNLEKYNVKNIKGIVLSFKNFLEENNLPIEQSTPFIAHFIIVAFRAGNSFYTDRFDKKPIWPKKTVRTYCRRKILAYATGNYGTFFLSELICEIEKRYRVRKTRESRFITGTSMGGGGAFKFILNWPELFIAAASISGGLGGRPPKDEKSIRRIDVFFPEMRQVFGDPDKHRRFIYEYAAANNPSLIISNFSGDVNLFFEYGERDRLARIANEEFYSNSLKAGVVTYPKYHEIKSIGRLNYKTKHGPKFFKTRFAPVLYFFSNLENFTKR